MGQRGPSKKPTNLVLLSGNAGHHKKASLEDEPKPKLEKPRCPSDLQGPARQIWRKLVGELYDLGLVSKIDRQMLKMLVMNIQIRDDLWDYLSNYKVLLESGEELHGLRAYLHDRKTTQQALHLRAMRDAEKRITEICQQFGMTASSRSRMHVLKPVEWEPSGIEGWLND